MSKMSELGLALDEMISCGEALIRTANALKEMFSGTAEPEKPAEPAAPVAEEKPEPAAPAVAAKTYTKEDVRAVLAAKSSAGFRKEVKALLAEFGATQLKQVDPESYGALVAKAEVIGNA